MAYSRYVCSWGSFTVLKNDANNSDTENEVLRAERRLCAASCSSALLQISVWSSGCCVVGGTDRHTVEKLKEGGTKTCSCMKAELL